MFRHKEVPVDIVFDMEQFQTIATMVRELINEVNTATNKLNDATAKFVETRKDIDKAIGRLQAEKRRPITRT